MNTLYILCVSQNASGINPTRVGKFQDSDELLILTEISFQLSNTHQPVYS